MQVRCSYDKLISIDRLKLNPNNRNVHPKEQIERLAEILNYQGWRYPVKVSNLSGMVTSGHGRIEAARINGWDKVPVNFQDYEDSNQEYADSIADNAIASWSELDLSSVQMDVGSLSTEFNVEMLGLRDPLPETEKGEPGCDEDEVPEKVDARTHLGDIYQLGSHRLMCGDSTSIDAIEKLMNGEKADLCFTSPPYNLGISSKLSGNSQVAKKGNVYESHDDKMSELEYADFLFEFSQSALSVSRYMFTNIQTLAGNRIALWDWIYRIKDQYCDTLIWDKQHAQPAAAERVVNSRFEFVFVHTSESNPNRAIRISPQFRGTVDNVYVGSPQRKNEYSGIHGATFPVHLPEYYINQFTNNGSSVLDAFGGSGSTLIACEKTNRRCFMMELDAHYCDVIVARWEKYTGKKSVLLNQGV